MGGCAGKFKGSDDLPPEPLPSDAPDQAEGETVSKEEVGEIKTEAPLVDFSEQKQEGEKPAEPETPAAEPEKKGETPVAEPEDKVEAPAAPEKEEEIPAAKETEKKESDVAPTSETHRLI